MKDSTKKLFAAGVELRDWQRRNGLSEDEVKTVMAAIGWKHLLSGHQQRQAARSTSKKKTAAARANGKLGGRPRKGQEASITSPTSG